MSRARILSGIDRIDTVSDLLRGKRIGLMTHPSAVDRFGRASLERLNGHFHLTALFACEHGIRGDRQAGEAVDSYQDPETGVPVFSLYGSSHRMTDEMLSGFDVFVFDMQEVGSRYYTYLYSLAFAMEACAQAGKPVVLLDRVNPLGGQVVYGTVLDPAFSSFVGEYPLPTRYGLTMGEYARFVMDHLHLDLDLTVVPVTGWQRSFYLDETDAPWVMPSPNCATLSAAIAFSGTCVFEGTNLSEGRGTTLPFELIGAPWLDTRTLLARIQSLPGIAWSRVCFTPTFQKWQGELCHGLKLHVTDRSCANVFLAALLLMDDIRALHPDLFQWRNWGQTGGLPIDRLLGTDQYSSGKLDAMGLYAAHVPLIDDFKSRKTQWELYP